MVVISIDTVRDALEASNLEVDERWAVEVWFYQEVVAMRGRQYAERWFIPVGEYN